MSELRWNPVLGEWVATATHRMDRPQMPEGWCPFCPGSGRVPDQYDVHIYPNDFPTFATPPPDVAVESGVLYPVREAIGVCEVVLYTPQHDTTLAELPVGHIQKLVALWTARYRELGSRPEIEYVFEFENKGEVTGVTMPHPHGQIYAFPFIPPRVRIELDSARAHWDRHGTCLFCDIIKAERADGRRVIGENRGFLAVLPFYARWPFEVHLFAKRHLLSFAEFTEPEQKDFAALLKLVLLKYDHLYGFSFPYVMVIHQAPTDGGDHASYHFHVEFYPPHRSKTKLKYLAGCESGAGTFINDSCAEEKARELQGVRPFCVEEL